MKNMSTNKEIRVKLTDNPGSDPLGMEGFLIMEDFESVFSGLTGVYARLSYKEKFRADQTDDELVESYRRKSEEIYELKRQFVLRSLTEIRAATEEYRPLLQQLEKLEAEKYG